MHRRTAQCTWGAEIKRRQLAAEEEREVTFRDLSAYGRPLEMVTYFKYLGQVILARVDNWTALVRNLAQAKTVWSRMSCILSREGATPRLSGFFLKDMIQAVLIFRAETWVVNPCMGNSPGGGSYPGGETVDGKYPAEENVWYLEIHLVGGGNGVGGILDDGGIH